MPGNPWPVGGESVVWGRGALALLFGVCLLAGCMERRGASTTEGALEALREEPPPDQPRIAERVGRYTVDGALDELSSPEGIERMTVIVDAAVARALATTAEAPSLGGPGSGGPTSMSYVERMARDSGERIRGGALGGSPAARPRRLRPPGDEPGLRPSTSRDRSSAGPRGAAALFRSAPAGSAARASRRRVRQLGRAASAGFMEGVFASSAWPAMAIAFLGGVGFQWGRSRPVAPPSRPQGPPRSDGGSRMTPPLSHRLLERRNPSRTGAQAGRDCAPGHRARHFTVYPRPSMQTANAF